MEKIIVSKADAKKCERCYRHQPEVGTNRYFPELCERCVHVMVELIDTGQVILDPCTNAYKRTDKWGKLGI